MEGLLIVGVIDAVVAAPVLLLAQLFATMKDDHE